MLASLRTLVAKPGQLTLDFLRGQHLALIDPVRLFVNVGVGSFLVTRLLPSDVPLFGVGPVLFGDQPSVSAWLAAVAGVAAAAVAHWLVLRRRRPYILDSAAFVLHVTAFSFMLAPLGGLLALLLRAMAPGLVLIADLLPVVALALYWIFALRRFNGSDRDRNAVDVLLIYGVFVLILLPLTLLGL